MTDPPVQMMTTPVMLLPMTHLSSNVERELLVSYEWAC
jgi:hypothetical protein